MANTYAIRITIDGSDVKREAGRVRQIIENELSNTNTQNASSVAQKTEAARRATIRQRGKTTLDVAEGRANIKE